MIEYFKPRIWSYVLSLAIIGVTVSGMIFGIEGTRNLAYFGLWTIGIVGTLAVAFVALMFFVAETDEVMEGICAEKAKSEIPFKQAAWFDHGVDAAIVILVVWLGHWVLGTFLMIQGVGHYLHRQLVKHYIFAKLKKNYG